MHKEATKKAIQRIKSRPVEFLRLIEKKFITQWADEDYGFYWSTIDFQNKTPFKQYLQNSYKKVSAISQMFYVFILLGAVAGCLYSYRAQLHHAVVFMLIFLGMIAAYTIFEVQSRYHYPVIPFLIIFAGYGMDRYKNHMKRSVWNGDIANFIVAICCLKNDYPCSSGLTCRSRGKTYYQKIN